MSYVRLVEALAAVERRHGPPPMLKAMSAWAAPEAQAALARWFELPRLTKAVHADPRDMTAELARGRQQMTAVKATLASLARTVPRPDPDARTRRLAREIADARALIGDAMASGRIPVAQGQIADARLRRLAADRLADAQGRPRQPRPLR